MKNKINKSLVSKYKSRRDEALATLEVYYNNPAGIGEHPQVLEEMSKLVEAFANAEDCLAQLNKKLKPE